MIDIDETRTQLTTNKALAVAFLDLISADDYDALGCLITEDWSMIGGPPGMAHGRAGLEQLRRTIGPVSQTWEVEHILAEGDLVAIRAVNRCEMDSFMGLPGQGIEQVFTATFLMRIEGDRIAFTWRNADDLGRLIQLGARIGASTA